MQSRQDKAKQVMAALRGGIHTCYNPYYNDRADLTVIGQGSNLQDVGPCGNTFYGWSFPFLLTGDMADCESICPNCMLRYHIVGWLRRDDSYRHDPDTVSCMEACRSALRQGVIIDQTEES